MSTTELILPLIWIVDDQDSFIKQLDGNISRHFRSRIFQRIDDLVEALEQLEASERPDLVMVDYDVEERSDGLDFIREYSGLFPEIPFALMTVSNVQTLGIKSAQAGAIRFFPKRSLLDSEAATYLQLSHTIWRHKDQNSQKASDMIMMSGRWRHTLSRATLNIGLRLAKLQIVLEKFMVDNGHEEFYRTNVQSRFGEVKNTLDESKDALDVLLRAVIPREEKDLPTAFQLQDLADLLVSGHSELSDIQCSIKSDVTSITCYERDIKVALGEVVHNAFKYASESGKVIRIEIAIDPQDCNFVVICVHDNGSGVPNKERKKVLMLGKRGSNVGNRPGDGIGLAVARKVIEEHVSKNGNRGRIEIESSNILCGALVSVYLPKEVC